MADNVSSNKLIAKNTIYLYIRMIVILIVTLFTSRIILDALGTQDYGINNIVNGIVVLFSFLNTALLTGTQRFLNFYLGKNDLGKVNSVFCMSMNAYFILSVIIFIVGETVGLWFVNTKLNIPVERHGAAIWVYQFTLLQFVLSIIRIPYNATIIAYEKMNFYAYVSLVEVLAKLIVAYCIYVSVYDKLIVFSFLNTIIVFVILLAYKLYCNKKYSISKFKLFWDKTIFNDIFSFSGWSLFGSMANLAAQQGLNILLNIFYGVALNAAAGIANQVSSAVNGFVSNFQVAIQPQITKSYASNDMRRFTSLIFQTSRFSFYLMFILIVPLFVALDTILDLWLVEVPKYTSIFCRLILIFLCMDAFSMPIVFGVQATGRIRNYQILMTLLILLNFPIAWYVLKVGYPPYSIWLVRIGVNILVILSRCIYMWKNMELSICSFAKETLLPVGLVIIITLPLPILLKTIFEKTIVNDIGICVFSLAYAIFAIAIVGITKEERKMISNLVINRLQIRR